MERAAAQQAQQSAKALRHTSSNLRTASLSNTLKGLTMRGGSKGVRGQDSGEGLGDEVASSSAAATPVPDKVTKTVSAHDGGCFTCAFDR